MHHLSGNRLCCCGTSATAFPVTFFRLASSTQRGSRLGSPSSSRSRIASSRTFDTAMPVEIMPFSSAAVGVTMSVGSSYQRCVHYSGSRDGIRSYPFEAVTFAQVSPDAPDVPAGVVHAGYLLYPNHHLSSTLPHPMKQGSGSSSHP